MEKKIYPRCRGSIRLDVLTQYSSPYLNVIDQHYMGKSTIYYGKVFPGYSWGMLWNRDLASLIPLTLEDEKAFSKVIRLKNGNLWLQCSDWVDELSREQNTTAVKTLEKYKVHPHEKHIRRITYRAHEFFHRRIHSQLSGIHDIDRLYFHTQNSYNTGRGCIN